MHPLTFGNVNAADNVHTPCESLQFEMTLLSAVMLEFTGHLPYVRYAANSDTVICVFHRSGADMVRSCMSRLTTYTPPLQLGTVAYDDESNCVYVKSVGKAGQSSLVLTIAELRNQLQAYGYIQQATPHALTQPKTGYPVIREVLALCRYIRQLFPH